MRSHKITMYAEKIYELEEIKRALKDGLNEKQILNTELKGEVIREIGEARTMMLVFDRYLVMHKESVSLSILLTEYRGYQGADIILAGHRGIVTDDSFSDSVAKTLLQLGFQS